LQGSRLQSRQDSNRLRLSFVQMPDDPTPLDSYRLQWDPCFDGDLMVALSLGDARQHLPVAILKLGDSPREILGIARRRDAGVEATVLDLLRKLHRSEVREGLGHLVVLAPAATRTGITLGRRRLPAGFPLRT
jgi:hypothetical protein